MNKKSITILILFLAVTSVISGCEKKIVNNNNSNQNIQNNKKQLEKYYDKELGIEFMYPKNYTVKISREFPKLDIGKKKIINVISEEGEKIFSLMATSKNYTEGVEEGCCFYYSGKPLNTKLSLDDISKMISNFEPINIKKVEINNQEGVRFYSLKNYVSIWAIDSVLIPYNNSNNNFTNLLIDSPILQTISYTEINQEESVAKESLVLSIRNNEFLKDKKVQNLYNLFNRILNTLKFVD